MYANGYCVFYDVQGSSKGTQKFAKGSYSYYVVDVYKYRLHSKENVIKGYSN